MISLMAWNQLLICWTTQSQCAAQAGSNLPSFYSRKRDLTAGAKLKITSPIALTLGRHSYSQSLFKIKRSISRFLLRKTTGRKFWRKMKPKCIRPRSIPCWVNLQQCQRLPSPQLEVSPDFQPAWSIDFNITRSITFHESIICYFKPTANDFLAEGETVHLILK